MAVVDSLYNIGLSSLDAKIGLWAVVTGAADFAAKRQKFDEVGACREVLPVPPEMETIEGKARIKAGAKWRYDSAS